MFKIRKAVESDLKTVLSLNQKLFDYEIENQLDSYVPSWAETKDASEYFLNLIKTGFVVLAEEKGITLGYLAGSIGNNLSYYEGKSAELENMFVEAKFRKNGVGAALVEKFFKWCKKEKAKRIFVTASYKNEPTIKFYKKRGFTEANITLKIDL